MIGDIVNNIKIFWEQQTCIHKDKYVNTFRSHNTPDFEQCTKCNRIKG